MRRCRTDCYDVAIWGFGSKGLLLNQAVYKGHADRCSMPCSEPPEGGTHPWRNEDSGEIRKLLRIHTTPLLTKEAVWKYLAED